MLRSRTVSTRCGGNDNPLPAGRSETSVMHPPGERLAVNPDGRRIADIAKTAIHPSQLNGSAILPWRSTAIMPPLPPSAGSFSITT